MTSTSSPIPVTFSGSYEGTYLNSDQLEVISITDIISSSASILGCISILVFAIYKNKVCHQSVQPLFHLAMADFCASASLLASCVVHVLYRTRSDEVFTLCSYLNGCVTGFFVITFFLTAAYAAEVYMRVSFQDKQRTGRGLDPVRRTQFEFMYLMYSMSWVIPLAVVITMVGYYATFHQETAQKDIHTYCNDSCLPFFSQNNFRVCGSQSQSMFKWLRIYKYLFLVPLLLSFAFNSVIYVKTVSLLRKSFRQAGKMSSEENKRLTRVKKNAILFLSIFFICWLPTVLIGIISSVEGDGMDMNRYYPLYICQALLSPLQGLLNTLGYGWQRREFKLLMCPRFPSVCQCVQGRRGEHETSANMLLS
ncbi:transmembrane protein 116-like [Sycon ciliatum]|uniref:transmembrane protein 116-like n=1 Tax=Sycon ciliatum TaxID=27933 RepID=UPI0020AA9BC2|eukprot:scpid61087/ scgid14734/ Transmembrane protein 116